MATKVGRLRTQMQSRSIISPERKLALHRRCDSVLSTDLRRWIRSVGATRHLRQRKMEEVNRICLRPSEEILSVGLHSREWSLKLRFVFFPWRWSSISRCFQNQGANWHFLPTGMSRRFYFIFRRVSLLQLHRRRRLDRFPFLHGLLLTLSSILPHSIISLPAFVSTISWPSLLHLQSRSVPSHRSYRGGNCRQQRLQLDM